MDGFEGPLDWLLEMARAQHIDLAKLSILALVEAFTAALDVALARERAGRADLSRWGDWLVMAATLTLLRSRLLLPKDAPEARAAHDEAEALRRRLLDRAAIQRAAEWLDRTLQLGRDVFPRGGGDRAPAASRSADINDLFRACLVALRVPEQAEAYQHRIPFWRVADAAAGITRMLHERPGGGGWPCSCRRSRLPRPSGSSAAAPRSPAPSWPGSSWPGRERQSWSRIGRGRTSASTDVKPQAFSRSA